MLRITCFRKSAAELHVDGRGVAKPGEHLVENGGGVVRIFEFQVGNCQRIAMLEGRIPLHRGLQQLSCAFILVPVQKDPSQHKAGSRTLRIHLQRGLGGRLSPDKVVGCTAGLGVVQ